MDRAMREALLAEVRRREKCRPLPSGPGGVDVARLARDKARPMVRGLFPAMERESILRLLESSVVFLTCENIGDVLTRTMWHRTAWDLAKPLPWQHRSQVPRRRSIVPGRAERGADL